MTPEQKAWLDNEERHLEEQVAFCVESLRRATQSIQAWWGDGPKLKHRSQSQMPPIQNVRHAARDLDQALTSLLELRRWRVSLSG